MKIILRLEIDNSEDNQNEAVDSKTELKPELKPDELLGKFVELYNKLFPSKYSD